MEEIIKKLVLSGLEVQDKEDLRNKINKKHWSRYKTCLYFLNRNNIPTTQSHMFAMYRIDIVIRRMIHIQIQAIEESLKTSILYKIEKMQWDFLDKDFGIELEDWKDDNKNKRKRKSNSKKFLFEALNSFKSKNIKNWQDAIWEMQLGQLSALLYVIKSNHFEKIINDFNSMLRYLDRYEILDFLDTLRNMRNNITHIKMLFSKILFIKKKRVNLRKALRDINNLSSMGFINNFKNAIDNYENNSIKKASKREYYKLNENDIKQIFVKIKEELDV